LKRRTSPKAGTSGAALDTLEFHRVLDMIALEARSEPGKRAILARVPESDIEVCRRRQAELAEMVRFRQTEGALATGALIDSNRLFSGSEPVDLSTSWELLRAIRAALSVREAFLSTDEFPHLRAIASQIEDLTPVVTEVGRYFTREGKLREDASPILKSLRSKIVARRGSIQKTLLALMRANESAIQDEIVTVRGDRYCIPVRADHRNTIQGILHERSGSGASFFIEPIAVVEANNDLAELLIQEHEEIARIERYIAGKLAEASEAIVASIEVAAEIDAIQAGATVFETMNASRPQFTTEPAIRIIDGRHPLLDERLASLRRTAFGEDESAPRRVVPTSISIADDRQALLVSGPNAGGKTVALKTAGLVVALATAGLPVPAAEGSLIPAVDRISVLIGDEQDVLEHRSTFSAYLLRLREILDGATPRSLVLLDELGSGTDPEEGAALSAAVIEYLLDTGCLVVATTHIAALKSVALNDNRIENASMEFDATSGQPTFNLVVGVPGRSRAIETAANVGLPARVIEAAKQKIGDRYGDMDRLIAELQDRSSRIQQERDSLKRKREEFERREQLLDQRLREAEEEKARVAEDLRAEVDRIRREVRSRMEQELANLRAMDRKERDAVNAKKLAASLERPAQAFAESLPRAASSLALGGRARHRVLGVEGEIVELSGGKATLRVGSKRMQVSVDDLSGLAGGETAKRSGRDERQSIDVDQEATAELNLIGKRVEEALEESDVFIDQSLLSGQMAVRIIHGFGTGRLRQALRDYLKKHPGVKSIRPGGEREGGDGATIAVLDV
jgi:DNA mismatch repair protein MutS2